MASFNDYHDYYDSRSRARSRSRPPPLQPQYEHYDHHESVPRSRVKEEAYLSPIVPYRIPMSCRTEERTILTPWAVGDQTGIHTTIDTHILRNALMTPPEHEAELDL
jgi:hypothetical protein